MQLRIDPAGVSRALIASNLLVTVLLACGRTKLDDWELQLVPSASGAPTVHAGGALTRGGATSAGGAPMNGGGAVGGATNHAGVAGAASSTAPIGASCVSSSNQPSLAFHGLDVDWDEDGLKHSVDNCPVAQNARQLDADADGLGDACDACVGDDRDTDGVCDSVDVCPDDWDPAQRDIDARLPGDACDPTRYCSFSFGPSEWERMLVDAITEPELQQQLAEVRWRWLSGRSFCQGDARGSSFELLLYVPENPVLTVTLDGNGGVKIQQRNTGAMGPQPSVEESREAMALAAGDPFAAEHLARDSFDVSVFFHAQLGKFPACSVGRCVEVLYDRGGSFVFRVVVDLSTCTVAGSLPPL